MYICLVYLCNISCKIFIINYNQINLDVKFFFSNMNNVKLLYFPIFSIFIFTKLVSIYTDIFLNVFPIFLFEIVKLSINNMQSNKLHFHSQQSIKQIINDYIKNRISLLLFCRTEYLELNRQDVCKAELHF
ncbi:Protein of unknown function [Gryllus bimaculatus]|nr:Protein of unknown function [Gryllus bimaculatus]